MCQASVLLTSLYSEEEADTLPDPLSACQQLCVRLQTAVSCLDIEQTGSYRALSATRAQQVLNKMREIQVYLELM